MQSAFGQTRVRDAEFLYESDDGTFITHENAIIELNHYGPWTAALTRLAKKHKVNALHITETYKQEWPTLDFLLDLPPLKRLHVVLARPADLTPITQLLTLQSLGLMGDVSAESATFDFAPLTKLEKAYVEITPATMSLLSCRSLQHLWIWNHHKPWLSSLDLSRLTKLRELHVTAWAKLAALNLARQPAIEFLRLEAIPKLKSIEIDPDAKLGQLKVGGCGAFRIDWDRLGNDLHELELVGPLRFPIEDVLRAPNLRKLDTNGIRTFPPLKFLLKLKHLEHFGYFATPPGPKFSEDDWRIVRTINARGR